MPQSRLDRAFATARLLPAAPIIGIVVVLSAVGLGPVAAEGPRAL